MTALRAEAQQPDAALRLPPTRRLGPRERARLIGEILSAYVYARRALRRGPIEATVAALRAQSAPSPTPTVADRVEAHRLGRAVGRTMRLLPGDTRCLTQSLVLTRLLARRAIAARLVIGARTEPEFLAHAWVECDGEPVLPRGEETFGRLVEL